MGLTIEGIIFMAFAWGIILILTGYCFYKVFTVPKKK